jgi:hypothetical protein
MLASMIPIVPIVLNRKLQDSIRHAKLICIGHEDTKECKLAWDRVEDIQKGINKKKETKKLPDQCEWDEKACREYDV